MADIKILNPDALGKPLGQYSHLTRVKASEFVFIAGQVGVDPDHLRVNGLLQHRHFVGMAFVARAAADVAIGGAGGKRRQREGRAQGQRQAPLGRLAGEGMNAHRGSCVARPGQCREGEEA